MYDPQILLLDEPLANLSSKLVYKISNIIYELKRSGKTIVLTSHDVRIPLNIVDRIVLLENGEIKSIIDLKDKSSISEYLRLNNDIKDLILMNIVKNFIQDVDDIEVLEKCLRNRAK